MAMLYSRAAPATIPFHVSYTQTTFVLLFIWLNSIYLLVFFDDYFFVIIIRIMHVLCIGNICVAKDNFPLTMFERDNKGILFIYF